MPVPAARALCQRSSGAKTISPSSGLDQRHALDQELFLAFHDQPEFREILVEVAPAGVRRRGHALRADDVGPGMVVPHRAAALAVRRDNVLLEIDKGLVDALIFSLAGIDRLDELDALGGLGRFTDGIAGRLAGGANLKAQGRGIAHRLHAVGHAIGHLHQETLGGDERLDTFDGDAHLARHHHPIDAVIGPEEALGFLAGAHRDVLADEIAGQDFGLGPVALAAVTGDNVDKFLERLVGGGVGRRLDRLWRPGGQGRGRSHLQRRR